MNPISSVSSAASQQLIAALQAQMLRYSQAANGQNSSARSDYRALQAAIKSGSVSDAQAALARLQRDSRNNSPAAATPAATSTRANPPVESEGSPVESAGAAQPWTPSSVDLTA